MATKQRCPKCNTLNALDAVRCSSCRAPLVQTCARCGRQRPWYVETCPYCDVRAEDSATFTNLFRQIPSDRLHGRYLVREVLATSRVSAVYRAVDASSPASVIAIKELSTMALIRSEERREAEAALEAAVERWSQLDHPALPKIIDTFKEHESHYVVLEFVEGWSGKRIIEEGRVKVTPELARNWGAQLCDLLSYLHAQNPPAFVPYLAPGHILVNALGVVRLVDLGLTAIFSPSAYGPYGSIRGYGAPELEGDLPSERSDLFSVGRLLYALLIGKLLEKGLARQMPLGQVVPGISPQLVKAIAQAANRDPAKRFATAGDLRHALWDEMEGPLQPMSDWVREAAQQRWQVPEAASPQVRTAEESMASAGYMRDLKYAPTPAAPKEEAPAGPPARLSVDPRQFRLTDLAPDEVRKIVLSVRNAGEGELVGRVISRVGWISAPEKTIHLPALKQAKVILTVRAAQIGAGRTNEPQALSVETNVGQQWVGVTVDMATGPVLHIETPILDFGTFQGEAERSAALEVANRGRQSLSGSVASRVSWLRVPQGALKIAGGKSARVVVTLLPDKLPRGEQRTAEALVVDSDGGQEAVEARAWRVSPELDLGATHMDFGVVSEGGVAERLLYVRNSGDGELQGTVRSLVPWLQVYPQQFACAAGEMAQVTVTADCVGLPDGVINIPQALRVQTNAGTRTLSLRAEVRAPRLVLGTSLLAFGGVPLGEARERRLVIRNDGSAPLAATIQSLATWLVPAVAVAQCEPHSELALTVRAETSSFAQGQELALQPALRIVAGATVAEVGATLTVLKPALRIEPETIDFGYLDRSQPERATLTIANDGTGVLAWNAQTDATWVEVAPKTGECAAGESTTLSLTAYALGLEAGVEQATATLVINSDGGRAKVPLRIALSAPMLAADTTFLDLPASVNRQNVSASFRIFNHGLGLLRGSLATDQTWLTVSRTSFECGMGRSVEVQVMTDMDEFPPSASYGSGLIRMVSNGGEAEIEAALNVTLAPHLEAPEVVILSRSAPEEALQGRLVLRNSGLAQAHVKLVAIPSAAKDETGGARGLELARSVLDIKPDKSVRIIVHYIGAPPEASTELAIEIREEERTVRVPVRLEL